MIARSLTGTGSEHQRTRKEISRRKSSETWLTADPQSKLQWASGVLPVCAAQFSITLGPRMQRVYFALPCAAWNAHTPGCRVLWNHSCSALCIKVSTLIEAYRLSYFLSITKVSDQSVFRLYHLECLSLKKTAVVLSRWLEFDKNLVWQVLAWHWPRMSSGFWNGHKQASPVFYCVFMWSATLSLDEYKVNISVKAEKH